MKIALLGDIGLFGKFDVQQNKDLEYYFSDYRKQIADCDFVIGNLEVPFSKKFKEFKPKSAVLGTSPENIDTLKLLGVTHVNLANNHVGDFGKEGYELTKKVLKKAEIEFFGIEGIQSLIHYEDNKICLNGFCNMDTSPVYLYGVDNKKRGINIADVDIIEKALTKSHNEGYLNILAFHTGLEHVHLPGKEDILFCRYLAEKFNYILYGHHPHVVQGFEKHRNSNLFYSLGNFCFDDVYSKVGSTNLLVSMSEANKLGLIPILNIENNKVIEVELLWSYLGKEKMSFIQATNNPLIDKIKSGLVGKSLSEIEKERCIALNKYQNQRKSLRNVKWYINRLNLRYAKLFLEINKNSRLYNKHYLSKVDKKVKGNELDG